MAAIRKFSGTRFFCITVFVMLSIFSNAQQTYTFVTCGATGSAGPTQAMANLAYASTNLSGSVTVIGLGIQQFTIPTTGYYRCEARGAQGYGSFGGRGALAIVEYSFNAGTVISIVVGQTGAPPLFSPSLQFGGGGASIIRRNPSQIILVAGGGGGSSANSFTGLSDGQMYNSGLPGSGGSLNGVAGGLLQGGATGGSGHGGSGANSNGLGSAGGKSIGNGSAGGCIDGQGGFGGGGGTTGTGIAAGGGGGYSGGGGSQGSSTNAVQGGGGGSYTCFFYASSTAGVNFGDGIVIIKQLCVAIRPNFNTVNNLMCSGASAILTATSANTYTWSNNANTSTIAISPTVSTVYSVTGTSTSGCTDTYSILINVFTPTLQTANPVYCCSNSIVVLSATGANSYTWNGSQPFPQITVPVINKNTIYTVSATSNSLGISCTTTKTVEVIAADPPLLTYTVTGSQCVGEIVQVSASSSNSYSWSTGDTLQSIFISASIPTSYTITLTAASNPGCQKSTTLSVNFSECTSIENQFLEEQVAAYPNPFQNSLSLKGIEIDKIEIFDIHSKLISSQKILDAKQQIDLNQLKNGIYYLNIYKDGKIIAKQKIIKTD